MTLLEQLITEINAHPTHVTCPNCEGEGEAQSANWKAFFAKYGNDAMENGTAFHKAEIAILMECDSGADKVTFAVAHHNLTFEQATDLVELYMESADIVPCEECEDGLVITDHGSTVSRLANLLKDCLD